MAKVTGMAELKRNLALFKIETKMSVVGAVFHGTILIQNEAKTNHPYTDRTGLLTNSIQAVQPKIKGNKIEGEVVAGMGYAADVELGGEKVEGGNPNRRAYPFMFPALEKMSQPINRGVMSAIKQIRWVER